MWIVFFDIEKKSPGKENHPRLHLNLPALKGTRRRDHVFFAQHFELGINYREFGNMEPEYHLEIHVIIETTERKIQRVTVVYWFLIIMIVFATVEEDVDFICLLKFEYQFAVYDFFSI